MNTPIKNLPGIGAKRAERFAALGIETVGELMYHFPRGYQHRGNIQTLVSVASSNLMTNDGDEHEAAAFMLTVGTEPRTALLKNRMTMTKFTAFDQSGSVTISFFNNKYISDIFKVGLTFRMWGRLKVMGGRFFLTAPDFELAAENAPLTEFVPIYPLTEGISQKIMYSTVKSGLQRCLKNGTVDPIPPEIRKQNRLCTFNYALQAMHMPVSYEMLEEGRRRFIFEELFAFALRVGMAKKMRRRGNAPVMQCDITPFEALLPYTLTGAQKRVISEISHDLANPEGIPMSRIVAGDVGSGKTVCAAAAAYIAGKNGYQSALMVPTSILASQHYADIGELLERAGLRVGLLIGSMKASEKKKVCEELENGSIDLIIGTHALLYGNVRFRSLGLVITDEQHRFGASQRDRLGNPDETCRLSVPHVMVMSATPIPRTLAMTIYGDLDMSVLDELPPGRQKVDTFVVNESYRERLNGFIRKNVSEGRQVYVVCPKVTPPQQNSAQANTSQQTMQPFNDRNSAAQSSDRINTNALSETVPHVRPQSTNALSETVPHVKPQSTNALSETVLHVKPQSTNALPETVPHVKPQSTNALSETAQYVRPQSTNALSETVPHVKPQSTNALSETVPHVRPQNTNLLPETAQNVNASSMNTSTPLLHPDMYFEDEENGTSLEVKNVTEWADKLRASLPELRIGLLHGKLKPTEKDAVMADFVAGKLDALVSTTVIEVGVNVPNATLMIVENAERFGLSQLHQLRGRVGRGRHKSWCILVSNSTSENTRARLGAMKSTNDGFKIAEYDLEQRGPGDFFTRTEGDSIRQHGALRFRLASLYSDTDMLSAAFDAAEGVIASGSAEKLLDELDTAYGM